MATYAAYRHVELDKVGCGKRSIMKPPGGDCHDIFGADFHGTPSHHRVLKPPGGGTSSLFAPSTEEKPCSKMSSPTTLNSNQAPLSNSNSNFGIEEKTNGLNGKPGNGNVPENKSVEPGFKGTQESSVDLISIPSSVLSAEIKNLSIQERKRMTLKTRNCVTGEGCQSTDHFVIRVHRQREGNPVTGEGYDTPETQTHVPARTRIPPGGYSSGLW